MTKYMELAQKLNRLAKEGIAGERETAQIKLDEIMAKYGITKADLESLEKSFYEFVIKPGHATLFAHIVLVACQSRQIVQRVPKFGKPDETRPCLELTKAQKIEVEAMYGFYSGFYDRELEIFNIAFIQRNQLVLMDKQVDVMELSPEEQMKAMRAMQMMGSVAREDYRRQISKP